VLVFQHEYPSVIQYSIDHPNLESKCLALFVSSFSVKDYKDRIDTLELELRPLEKEAKEQGVAGIWHLAMAMHQITKISEEVDTLYSFDENKGTTKEANQFILHLRESLKALTSDSIDRDNSQLVEYVTMLTIMSLQKTHDEGVKWFEKAKKITDVINNSYATAWGLRKYGLFKRRFGQNDRSIELLERGLDQIEGIEPTNLNIELLYPLATAHHRNGDFNATLGYFQQAYEISETICSTTRLGIASGMNVGGIHMLMGNHKIALNYYFASWEKYKKNNKTPIASIFANIMLTYNLMGETKEALKFGKQENVSIDQAPFPYAAVFMNTSF